MGVLAHYITVDWQLVEELIGFEQLKNVHSGSKLASILNKLLQKFNIHNQVISITTNNASNNSPMIKEVNEHLQEAFENHRFLDGKIQHIPCLAHIAQLALRDLLGKIRLRPTNKTFITEWEAEQELSELERIRATEDRGIPYILAKVHPMSSTNLSTNPIH